MVVSRALRLSALLVVTLMGGTAAHANGPALVVDAASGRVLHAERATDPWYPASVTKLMTAYVALDMVKRGEARLDQLLTVSEAAHALPPSKMAFKPGSQITLDNALKIIMVKSANDVAAVIAENLGGSIEGFAARMNETAMRIGMKESNWVNPHGLPDDRQHTSARDMAVLARALFTDFPQHGELFQIGAIQFGRRVMRNHNGLIGRYPGADGMKTGFICASGFNVVASATRNGRRLITVVMGSNSANERTLKAAELFDLGFERQAFLNPTLERLPASALAEPPNMRPVICDRRGPVPGEDDTGGLNAATEASSFSAPNLMAFAAAPANRTVLGPRGPVNPVRVWLGSNPPSEADLNAQEAAEDAEEQARIVARKAKRAVAAKPVDKPAEPSVAAGTAAKPAQPAPKVVNAKPEVAPARENGRATLSVKPVSSEAAKPAVKTVETPPAKPAAAAKKPATADKPEPAKPAPRADAKATTVKTVNADPKAPLPKAAALPKPAPSKPALPKPALQESDKTAKPTAPKAGEAKSTETKPAVAKPVAKPVAAVAKPAAPATKEAAKRN